MMTEKKKICPFCQREFVPENSATVYCSVECRKGMRRKRSMDERKNRTLICKYCGKSFVSDWKRKYCSEECCKKANGGMKTADMPKSVKKESMSTLAQINELARAAGMNYGQYVARHNL